MVSSGPLMSLSSEQGPLPAGQDLAPDTIHQLLREAETRLRQPSLTHADDQLSLAPKLASSSAKHSIPKLSSGQSLQSYICEKDNVAAVSASRMVTEEQRRQSNVVRPVGPDSADSRLTKTKITAGSQWFDLPKTDISTDLKRDLQLLRMRSVLDPKRHYKKESGKAKPPEFSHVGTLIEGPTEFFSSRIAKKDRKRTFVDETLAVEESNSRFKDKYNQVQGKKTSGKKDYYKSLQAKRKSKNKRFG